jgi:hypothetical protein
MSQNGLCGSGDFKAAPEIRQNGPAAGGRYVLPGPEKVKVSVGGETAAARSDFNLWIGLGAEQATEVAIGVSARQKAVCRAFALVHPDLADRKA